jgi:hypothetical protein
MFKRFPFMALTNFAEQEILCLLQINNGQSLSCHNYYSANLILRATTNDLRQVTSPITEVKKT